MAHTETVPSLDVNVVGWIQAENGIGEDARVAHAALTSAGLEAAVIDAARKVPPPTAGLRHLHDVPPIADRPIHGITLVFLDAATQFRYYAHGLLHGERIHGRVNILISPWELPTWPAALNYLFDHVDEFWAASEYIRQAFAPHFKDKSIQLAPPAVVVPESELDSFNIAEVRGTFVCLTTFDGASSIHRKNPFAVVKAFQSAFSPGKDDVELVIKTMNFSTNNPDLHDLATLISGDKRIRLVNEALSRRELFALIRSSHCFVSLHRAEGFGRNIAEHMLFKRPVIVSRFSGNTDFCFDETSYPVEGDLIPVGGHYWYSEGQKWFDASVSQAAQQMRRVYENRSEARRIAEQGQEFIQNKHSAVATGIRYRALLASAADRYFPKP